MIENRDEITEILDYLKQGGELTGVINGKIIGLVNVREKQSCFFVGYNGSEYKLWIDKNKIDKAIVYKGKTIRFLLEKNMIDDIQIF